MVFNTYSERGRHQGLVNELKGHLFEYLVGLEISRQIGDEKRFLLALGRSYRNTLKSYEQWLRNNALILLDKLPGLAKKMASEILNFFSLADLDEVHLVGKMALGPRQSFIFKEADLILKKGGTIIPISLKFCREHSFVNTKSGGIFSFIQKYFYHYFGEKSIEEQSLLTHKVKTSFHQMVRELYELANLEYKDSFGAEWVESGYSELPGQLPRPFQELVWQHYQRVIVQIYQSFEKFRDSPQKWKKSLDSLLGFGDPSMYQAICYHSGTETYDLKNIIVEKSPIEKDSCLMSYGKKASFEILLDQRILQIRVKPMNKFTTPGLKVNCSVKREIHEL